MKIIDFHTHIFPDALADKAMEKLGSNCTDPPSLDGRLSSLLDSMDRCGIKKSVICSIATKPEQFFPILNWSKEIRSSRIEPFISFHPEDKDPIEKIRIIKAEGFKGIKLHPFYQNFYFNDENMFKIYEEIIKQDLILLSHAGYDIAFTKERRVSPDEILEVNENFPELKLVLAHLGGWEIWEEVLEKLVGKNIYLDMSYAIDEQNPLAEKIINKHNENYLLFATDSPWADQGKYISIINKMIINEDKKNKILYENAKKLLSQ